MIVLLFRQCQLAQNCFFMQLHSVAWNKSCQNQEINSADEGYSHSCTGGINHYSCPDRFLLKENVRGDPRKAKVEGAISFSVASIFTFCNDVKNYKNFLCLLLSFKIYRFFNRSISKSCLVVVVETTC